MARFKNRNTSQLVGLLLLALAAGKPTVQQQQQGNQTNHDHNFFQTIPGLYSSADNVTVIQGQSEFERLVLRGNLSDDGG